MNKKLYLYISIFAFIVIIFVLFIIFFNINNKKNINVKTGIEDQYNIKKVFVCDGNDCVKDNFKNCKLSQYFDNKDDVINSKGIAIFGESDSKCNIIFSYNLKENLVCLFDKDHLNDEVLNKLWSSSPSSLDKYFKDNCKFQNIK